MRMQPVRLGMKLPNRLHGGAAEFALSEMGEGLAVSPLHHADDVFAVFTEKDASRNKSWHATNGLFGRAQQRVGLTPLRGRR